MQLRVADVRKIFERITPGSDGMMSVKNLAFIADEPWIFAKPNYDYVDAELSWYESQSLDVNDLADEYGKRVTLWDAAADKWGNINSNYGYLMYSEENGSQWDNVIAELRRDPNSRRALAIYQRPSMHTDAFEDGRNDFVCTNAVQYYISARKLNCVVSMRSNDLVYGYNNDWAWQDHLLLGMAYAVDCTPGTIHWHCMDAHVYPRHQHLVRP